MRGGAHTKERTFGQQTAKIKQLDTFIVAKRSDLATVDKNEVMQLKMQFAA